MPITEEVIEKRIQKKHDAQVIRAFKKSQRIHMMTSRFNTETRDENRRFCEENWKNGCVYCCPQEVSQNIPLQSKMIVLEMDNDKNQIYAIGMCSNKPFTNKYSVYQNNNYNRYNYIGKHRIWRNEASPLEEAVLKALDQLCFYGNDHMKRGQGLKAFPVKLLVNCKAVIDLPEFLENMFNKRFMKNSSK
jgi:hypothetical protein